MNHRRRQLAFHQPRFNPWQKRKGAKRTLYHRLVLGELVGITRVPHEAGWIMDRTDPREIASLEAKGLSPEGAAVELALQAGLEITSPIGLCPYCAEWLPDHRAGCELIAARVARRR